MRLLATLAALLAILASCSGPKTIAPGPGTMAIVAPPPPDPYLVMIEDRKGSPHAPKQIEIVDSLPLTAVGKVDKKVLRAKYWAGQARQVG